ncbi:MAG: glycoside hydrolase family 97 N-terminal domain-containing protein, partial [Bacteroidales bacterium]|nr:glycoside hydrolase family 97 N-terminal domain-containing protein [Bacteroidales bacterium]
MRKTLLMALLLASGMAANAQKSVETTVHSQDGNLQFVVNKENGKASYSVIYKGQTVIEKSPLGLLTDAGDFTQNLEGIPNSGKPTVEQFSYQSQVLKKSNISVSANHLIIPFHQNGVPVFDLEVMVKNNDIAFRYLMKRIPGGKENDSIYCAVIKDDQTHFNMPAGTKTFLSPQMKGNTGWSRTAPSYELPYYADDDMGKNFDGAGFIFPCLFKTPGGWVMVSETGVTSAYCASHLVCEKDGKYKIANPMDADFNYNGTSAPGIPLPGATPWRTITVGSDLAPIAETTIPWDFVEPLYEPSKTYDYGAGTWSW